MKALNLGIIMIIVIIMVIHSGIGYIRTFSDEFNKTLALAQAEYNIGESESAAKKLDELKISLGRSYTLLCVILDHNDVMESELSLLRLTEYVKTDDKTLFNAECSSLIARIDNIYASEKLNVANIF